MKVRMIIEERLTHELTVAMTEKEYENIIHHEYEAGERAGMFTSRGTVTDGDFDLITIDVVSE